ncbi:MAG: amidohydrolase family protein [Planctomycetes bacterium]|nr:amidohydrolase family protein [Planctomycetota bacterium]
MTLNEKSAICERGKILEYLLAGRGLETFDVVDCHSHMGPALYQQVPDGDPDGLVRTMDGMGVRTICVSHTLGLVSDWELGNTLLIEAVRKYPERIFGYAVFNPRYAGLMDAEMDRCFAAGLRGVKIHPDFHRMPATAPEYDRAYDRAQSENRIILCHYGAGPGQFAGSPLYKTVVERFPRAKFVMAHSLPGIPAVDTAVEFFGSRPNVRFCLANAFPSGVIEYARKKLGVERLLYGSDGCWSSMSARLGLVCATELDDEDKLKILGQNMRQLINASA